MTDACWYFAYGSNMGRATFVERRGMLAGAREQALPAEYLDWLAAFPLAVDERETT